MKKVILVDGHNLLFRMFYGIPSPIRNSKGEDIRGLIGFIGSLKKIVEKFDPYSLVVVFDSETSKHTNLEIDNTYKENRVDYSSVIKDENPFSQLVLIYEVLNYLNISFVEVENNEADDYIASIIFNNYSCDYQFIIVSTDSDFLQLVNNNVFLYVPRGKKSVLYTNDVIENKYGISSNKYVDFKSLVGDRCDNIKGVRGIGKVSALKVLKYPSIDEYIVSNPDSKLSVILLANRKIIIKNILLISLKKDIDTSAIVFSELSKEIYYYKTYEILKTLGFL